MKIGDRVRVRFYHGLELGTVVNVAYNNYDNDKAYLVEFDNSKYDPEMFYTTEVELVVDGNDVLKDLCIK